MEDIYFWTLLLAFIAYFVAHNREKITERTRFLVSKEKRPAFWTGFFAVLGIILTLALPFVLHLGSLIDLLTYEKRGTHVHTANFTEISPFFNEENVRPEFLLADSLIIAILLILGFTSLRYLSLKTGYHQPSARFGKIVSPLGILIWISLMILSLLTLLLLSDSEVVVGSLEWFLFILAIFQFRLIILMTIAGFFLFICWIFFGRKHALFLAELALRKRPKDIDSFALLSFTAENSFDDFASEATECFGRALMGVTSLYPYNLEPNLVIENYEEKDLKERTVWFNKELIGQPRIPAGIMKLSAIPNTSVEGALILFLEDYEEIIAPEGYQAILDSIFDNLKHQYKIERKSEQGGHLSRELQALAFLKYQSKDSLQLTTMERIKRHWASIKVFFDNSKTLLGFIAAVLSFIVAVLGLIAILA
ncbi:MAG: hypothetical protein ACE5OZ_13830 [Candidatus Heimdallarchaeota archaeon]